ncbi:MAG: superoxide dismutase [Beijerinckiaceae bacterium]|nr:superoxide dismutase [Beijerinckiaceae bacterium]
MNAQPAAAHETAAPVGPYVLPPLKFAYDALEPVIDAETMRLHHDKHHQGYVDKVNEALEKHSEWLGLTIEEILRRLKELPEDIRQTVRNQGGGHANHQFFWKIMTPGGAPAGPTGDLKAAIETEWGSFEAFKAAFETAGAGHFGSGWVFLVCRPKRSFKLEILTLPNQDSVLLQEEPAPGLLACDLWEHAYYLKHRNARAAWLKAWWDVVNWPYIGERLAGVKAGKKQL